MERGRIDGFVDEWIDGNQPRMNTDEHGWGKTAEYTEYTERLKGKD